MSIPDSRRAKPATPAAELRRAEPALHGSAGNCRRAEPALQTAKPRRATFARQTVGRATPAVGGDHPRDGGPRLGDSLAANLAPDGVERGGRLVGPKKNVSCHGVKALSPTPKSTITCRAMARSVKITVYGAQSHKSGRLAPHFIFAENRDKPCPGHENNVDSTRNCDKLINYGGVERRRHMSVWNTRHNTPARRSVASACAFSETGLRPRSAATSSVEAASFVIVTHSSHHSATDVNATSNLKPGRALGRAFFYLSAIADRTVRCGVMAGRQDRAESRFSSVRSANLGAPIDSQRELVTRTSRVRNSLKEEQPMNISTNRSAAGRIFADGSAGTKCGSARIAAISALVASFVLISLFSPVTAQADPPDMQVVGTWGGSVECVFIEEDVNPWIAYVGSGRRLVILNVEDPANIIELGSIDLENLVKDVAVRDGYAYVCTYFKPHYFSVVDVSNPASPRLVWHEVEGGVPLTAWHPAEVNLYGNYAFVLSGTNRIYAYNISDPENVGAPAIVAYVVNSSVIVGDLLYTASTPRLIRIYDLSAPWDGSLTGPGQSYLHFLGEATLPGEELSTSAIAVEGDYAYVSTLGQEGQLAVVNISNPNSPIVEGSYPPICGFVALTANDSLVYVTECGEISIMDAAANPANPTLVTNYDTHGAIGNVVIHGQRAYVTDAGEGLLILDISNVANRGVPVRLGNWHSPRELRKMDKVGNLLYVSDKLNGITILDVSDVRKPELVGVYQTGEDSGRWGDNWGIEVRDDKAYLSAGKGGIEIVNVSDPTRPTMLGAFRFNAGMWSRAITLDGDIAHVGVQRELPPSYLVNFDISDPYHIVDVGFVELGSGPTTIDVNENIASLARYGNGGWFDTVETSDPTTPIHLGGGIRGGIDLVRTGDLAYLANESSSYGGLYVVDVSHPDSPTEIGYWAPSTSNKVANGVAQRGGLAYITGGSDFHVLDVTDPSAITLVNEFFLQSPRAIFLDGRYAYVASLAEGISIIDLGLPIGDVNYDGCVNLPDLAALLAHYGASTATYDMGDLDADGDVDLSDLAELLGHYGEGCF